MTERVEIDFDHHSPELVEGLNEIYGRMRAECPVAHTDAHGGFWVVSSRQYVAEVASNPVFSSKHDLEAGYGGNTIPPAPVPFGLVHSDPPYWTAMRRVLNPLFSPPAVDRLRPLIQDVTTHFIDRIIEQGEGDFIDDIASPIPAVITMVQLAVPLDRWRLYADALHHMNTSVPGTPAGLQAAAEVDELVADLTAIIAERIKPGHHDGPDVLSMLCRTEIDGVRLTAEQVLGEALLQVAGGVDTTTSLLGSSFAWLSMNPDECTRLRQDKSLLPLATEEFLRYFAPVTAQSRTCSKDTEVGGQLIREGEPVLMSYVGANRDPESFENPDEFVMDRWPNRHTSFGLGIHRCLGSNLARAIFQTVTWEVLQRLENLRIDTSSGAKYPDFNVNQGWVNLPMTFTPGQKVGSDIRL